MMSMDVPSGRGAGVQRLAPSRGFRAIKLGEVLERRELVYFLTWRDVKVRYKQTLLGAAWAILQPLLGMVVFSVFFGRLAKMPSDGVPYPIFVFSALVPWTFFANALTQSANSLVSNAALLKKVYLPRLAVPIASVLSGVLDFFLALAVLLGMMAYYGIALTMNILVFPLFLTIALVTALGAGLWLAALNVQFRDVRHAVPFLVQFWLFATPIAYPSSLLEGTARTLFGLNPMVGVVEGFRWALLGAGNPPGAMLATSAAIAVLMLVTGAMYFSRMERTFADVV